MIEVRRSPVHGRGCFATRAIAAGRLIGTCTAEPTADDGPHVLWIAGERPVVITNEFRFLNHAAAPNAELDDSLEVHALRPIAAGEEITIHYGPEWQ